MSFILDALRKSEHERQRSAAPGLSHVPMATPRREIPVWTFVVIGVLAATVLVLGGAWWQAQRSVTVVLPSSAAVTPSAVTSPAPAPTPPATATPAVTAPPTAAPPAPAETRVAGASGVSATPTPTEPRAAAVTVPPPAALTDPAATDPAASAPTAAARLREPAPDSLATAAALPKEAAPSAPTLPSAAALLAQGIDVPALHLELHGYGATPAERFVFINGRKYKEGERLGEGPEVVAIEPNGVVLSQQGHRFMLAPE